MAHAAQKVNPEVKKSFQENEDKILQKYSNLTDSAINEEIQKNTKHISLNKSKNTFLPSFESFLDLTASLDSDSGDCWLCGSTDSCFFTAVKRSGVWKEDNPLPNADELKDYFYPVEDSIELKKIFQEASKALGNWLPRTKKLSEESFLFSSELLRGVISFLPSFESFKNLTASIDSDSGDVWLRGSTDTCFFTAVKRSGVWKVDNPLPNADEIKEFFNRIQDSNELKSIFVEASKSLNSGQLSNGIKLVEKYIELKTYKFGEIVLDLYLNAGDIVSELFVVLKQSYAAYRENVSEDIYKLMDRNIRAIDFNEIISQVNEEKKSKTNNISLLLTAQDVKELLKEKFPQKYRRLKLSKELQGWAKIELTSLNETYRMLLDGGDINCIEAREMALEKYN
jgi:hypothetical protein